ncbi:hypothetical protein BDR07DRAFT_1410545 [Suillus spraguei]|nr:hypothetical protein BDR07DRAFT_1410545 [Suillus spraguei]
MSRNSCRMLLRKSFQLASMISLTRNVTLLGTSQCAPSGHCMGSSTYGDARRTGNNCGGMDRFLLNGRNLQPCKEAIERFEKLSSSER